MKKILLFLILSVAFVSCNKTKKDKPVDVVEQKVDCTDQLKATQAECQTKINSVYLDCPQNHIYPFYIVVGAFRDSFNAKQWTDSVALLGYRCNIIYSHNDWYLTCVNGGDDFKSTLKIMENIRGIVTARAWVYVNRNK